MQFGKSLCVRLLAVVFALSCSFPVFGQTTQINSQHSEVAVALPSIHIHNFGRISTNYYRGSQPEGRDYNDLAALGVKTVINLTSDDAKADEQEMVKRAGMNYVQIPMTTHVAPTPQQIEKFLSLVNDPANQPVFVHCVGGRHRTGVMTAVYRMTDDGWSADQAFKEMKQFKFGMDFLHPEFKKFVYEYHPMAAHAAATAAQPTSPDTARPTGSDGPQ